MFYRNDRCFLYFHLKDERKVIFRATAGKTDLLKRHHGYSLMLKGFDIHISKAFIHVFPENADVTLTFQ